jgi:hypothetical protein
VRLSRGIQSERPRGACAAGTTKQKGVMISNSARIVAAALITLAPTLLSAQIRAGKAMVVTPDNFTRAETDTYFSAFALKDGAFGKFHHSRELAPVDVQKVIRPNRDTLSSVAVFDLNAGPVTITLPAAGKRFMSMQVIDQDGYTPMVVYGAGKHTLTRKKIGTRYAVTAVRTFVDPADPKDVQQAQALQNAIKVRQKRPGKFEVPNWDPVSQKKVRDALLALADTLPNTNRMFGARGKVHPVRHLMGAALGWGEIPEKEGTYLNVVPAKNDGATIHKVIAKDVPVDGFWSISIYNANGFYEPNKLNAYTINSVKGKKGADGSVTVQFGGCDGTIPNCIPIMKGWNYMVRLYRPRAEILNGKWKFPEAKPASRDDG